VKLDFNSEQTLEDSLVLVPRLISNFYIKKKHNLIVWDKKLLVWPKRQNKNPL
jgi:hypothetical protein